MKALKLSWSAWKSPHRPHLHAVDSHVPAEPPRQRFRGGDTIVELAAYRPQMQRMCIEEGNTQPDIEEPAHKLFKVRFADNEGRRRSASFLVQRRYAWRGYTMSAGHGVQPNRITLSAYDGDDVIATISVGLDSSSGLFVDALFRDELARLRARGARVCEFTKLAIDEAVKSKTVIASLFHVAYIHARRIRRCSDLLVEVNPRHVRFYERMLGFRTLGHPRMDPRVGAPAALLHLDLAHAEGEIARVGGHASLGDTMRSLYPFFFSPHEEAGIESRLRAYA
jgi:hypothetical protein